MVRTSRKRFRALAAQLRSGKDLSIEQTKWLSIAFEEIANGVDANVVLGVIYLQGRKKADEVRREKLGLLFSWIMVAIEPSPYDSETGVKKPLRITAALNMASDLSKERGSLFHPISFNSLRRAWYHPQKKYDYLKRICIHPLDIDSPFGESSSPR